MGKNAHKLKNKQKNELARELLHGYAVNWHQLILHINNDV